jgi:hypothetical protein
MDLHSRTRRNLVPVVGGITAMATATGVYAAIAQVAPAGAGSDSATPALGAAGLAGAGTFESCEAYFGFGKDEEASGLVDFDVFDINGDDPAAHDVDADTTVRLILENEEGETLECVPVELTETMWDDEFEGDPAIGPFPGPGHYIYPSVELDPFIEDFGDVEAVGFRVVTIPGGEHSLVSPEGVQPLTDFFLHPDDLFFNQVTDPDVIAHLASSEAGAEGADAFEDAIAACGDEEEIVEDDPDLVAAGNALLDLIEDEFEFTEVSCNDVGALQAFSSRVLSVAQSAAYTEEITLSLSEAPTPTPPVAPPAVAADAEPNLTG